MIDPSTLTDEARRVTAADCTKCAHMHVCAIAKTLLPVLDQINKEYPEQQPKPFTKPTSSLAQICNFYTPPTVGNEITP